MMLLALAQQPELLVLDEPTDGLDPVVRRDVLEALLTYVSSHAATVLISSHLVHELERICDWIAVMDRGRLVAELPMQEFKDGIKRLTVADARTGDGDPPFTVLARKQSNGGGEQWLVRGWTNGMQDYFAPHGATLREVIDLDLEEGFVELLRSFRGATGMTDRPSMWRALLETQWKWTRGMLLLISLCRRSRFRWCRCAAPWERATTRCSSRRCRGGRRLRVRGRRASGS